MPHELAHAWIVQIVLAAREKVQPTASDNPR